MIPRRPVEKERLDFSRPRYFLSLDTPQVRMPFDETVVFHRPNLGGVSLGVTLKRGTTPPCPYPQGALSQAIGNKCSS